MSIRIDRPFPLPEYVKDALQSLNKAGFVAYLAGGSVRDFLLLKNIKDYDIATNAKPDDLAKLFPDALETGRQFGVFRVPLSESPFFLEIATFRSDGKYLDHRHPKEVQFLGAKEDALRRDFTINGLFYDPKTQKVLDYVGGLEDLNNRVIRAIGDPHQRFKEDALRLMRAVRFTTRMGFLIEETTAKAIKKNSHLIEKISMERIRDEFLLMVTHQKSAVAVELLSQYGILSCFLPELEHLKKIKDAPIIRRETTIWQSTIRLLEILDKLVPTRSITLAIAALLHDIGKPVAANRSQQQNFNHHERDGEKVARRICKRLKLSNTDTDLICHYIIEQLKFKEVFQMRDATLQKWVMQDHFSELLLLHQADAIASDGNLAYFEFSQNYFEKLKKTPPTVNVIDGTDLIQLGFQPGPDFTLILETIENLALENKISTKKEALEFVINHFVK